MNATNAGADHERHDPVNVHGQRTSRGRDLGFCSSDWTRTSNHPSSHRTLGVGWRRLPIPARYSSHQHKRERCQVIKLVVGCHRRAAIPWNKPGMKGLPAVGRPPLDLGTHGRFRTYRAGAVWRSRCYVRDFDGVVRECERTGRSAAAAERALGRRCAIERAWMPMLRSPVRPGWSPSPKCGSPTSSARTAPPPKIVQRGPSAATARLHDPRRPGDRSRLAGARRHDACNWSAYRRSVRSLWNSVDLTARTLTVEATVVRLRGAGLHRKPEPKTAASNRVLTLPGWCVQMLALRYEAFGPAPAAPVFPSPKGMLRDPSRTRQQHLKDAFRNAGFEWATSHVLRKTVANILDSSGLSAREIADQL